MTEIIVGFKHFRAIFSIDRIFYFLFKPTEIHVEQSQSFRLRCLHEGFSIRWSHQSK